MTCPCHTVSGQQPIWTEHTSILDSTYKPDLLYRSSAGPVAPHRSSWGQTTFAVMLWGGIGGAKIITRSVVQQQMECCKVSSPGVGPDWRLADVYYPECWYLRQRFENGAALALRTVCYNIPMASGGQRPRRYLQDWPERTTFPSLWNMVLDAK